MSVPPMTSPPFFFSSLSLLCILLLSPHLQVLQGLPADISSDKEALLAFKKALQSSESLLDWAQNDPTPCHWTGVSCNNAQLAANSNTNSTLTSPTNTVSIRVVSVSLAGLSLAGSISPSLTDLSSLTYLNLSSNHLSGAIPMQLWKASALQVLDLSFNELSGGIGPEISAMIISRLRQ